MSRAHLFFGDRGGDSGRPHLFSLRRRSQRSTFATAERHVSHAFRSAHPFSLLTGIRFSGPDGRTSKFCIPPARRRPEPPLTQVRTTTTSSTTYLTMSLARQFAVRSVRASAGARSVFVAQRRWNSDAAPANPKIATIVDQISTLTLLETADLVASLKVR